MNKKTLSRKNPDLSIYDSNPGPPHTEWNLVSFPAVLLPTQTVFSCIRISG